MRLLLILLCTLASALSAQVIDVEASRFLSAPHARSGCYSPYRLMIKDLDGLETLEIRSVAPGVVLTESVAVGGLTETRLVLPVFVGEGSRIEIGDEVHTPDLPSRRVEPDYARPYIAVFSHDPVYARAVLPSSPGSMICDYFDLREFFTDWRMLDAYDALVIFNPSDVRLPDGSQRAIAEFCSLGGSIFIAGSFRFGEQAVDIPAPAAVEILTVRELGVRRFAYGPGAILRVGWDEFERTRNAQLCVTETLQQHYWYSATRAPGGEPASRVPPDRPGYPRPLAVEDTAPGILFWGLAAGLLLVCWVAPVVSGRASKRSWVAHAFVGAGCLAIAGAASVQPRPQVTLELSSFVYSGDGDATSSRTYIVAQTAWGEQMSIELNSDDRRLPKSVAGTQGWSAWVVFEPLTPAPGNPGEEVELAFGRVGDLTFRDFSTLTRRGETAFAGGEPELIEFWLDQNAYRGRRASLASVEARSEDSRYGDVNVTFRGSIRVVNTVERP